MYLLKDKTITLKEVSIDLDIRDIRTTKDWLEENHVPITKKGGKHVVSEFLFRLKKQLNVVEQLMLVYPTKWQEIFEASTEDKELVNAVFKIYPRNQDSRVKKSTTNKELKEFIK